MRNFSSKKLSRSSSKATQIFPEEFRPICRRKKAQASAIQNFNPQEDEKPLVNSLHVSRRFGSELSRWIRRTVLECRNSSKSSD